MEVLWQTLAVAVVFALGAVVRFGPQTIKNHPKLVISVWALCVLAALIIFICQQ